MAQTAPELRWTRDVEEKLAQADYAAAVTVLYSILYDPAVDNVLKHSLNHFPYREGTRALSDGAWYVIYSVDGTRNVMIHQIYPRSYIEQLPVRDDPTPP